MGANQFVPIRVSTLRGDLKIEFNVYIRVAGRFILYCRKGDSFEGQRLHRLREKKLKQMFITDEQESLYRDYMAQSIERAYDQSSDKPIETRAEIIQGIQQAATEDLMDEPDNRMYYDIAKAGARRYVDFIINEHKAVRAILGIPNVDNDIAHHGVNVATLAIGIAHKLGFDRQDPERMLLLTLGCLIHDIEHKYTHLDIGRPVSEFSSQELKIYQRHPRDGAARVNDISHFDQLVTEIIAQHEEKINGSGFPQGLKEKDMDPLVLAAATANTFDRYLTFEHLSRRDALKTLLIDKMGLHPLEHMKALQNFLKERDAFRE